MLKKNAYKLYIFIPAFIACCIDLIVTTINQPTDYWIRALDKVNEINPVLNFAMRHHILGIFLVTFIWLLIIAFLTLISPEKLSKLICLTIVLGNSWGASTWISRRYGYYYAILLFILNASLYLLFDEKLKKYSPSNTN
ncbi:MAG: hypothetical protein OCD02_08405 [Spirochaetaceae bacterium]